MDSLREKLKKFGRVKANEPLSRHTTFKIGGPARYMVIVEDSESLAGLLDFAVAEGLDYFILGGGSNVLASDDGFDGVVIKVSGKKAPKKIERIEKGCDIIVEAGVLLGDMVDLAIKGGLAGMEWAIGIPGTVGGAVRGNAGAMGKDVSLAIKWVEVWQDGEVKKLQREDCGFGYRDSMFKHSKGIAILRACVSLEYGSKKDILSAAQTYLARRKKTSNPSAGSFFKNIKLDKWPGKKEDLPEQFLTRGAVPAGWLIEQLGLKGISAGKVGIFKEHGNYIINADKASQADVLALVEDIKKRVYNKFGVELEPEVEIL